MAKVIKNVNLALQGGGAHGAFAWGILDKILEDGRLNIDGLCATSAGSLNASVFSYGRLKGGNDGARHALYDFWQDVSKARVHYSDIPTPFDNIFLYWNLSIFDTFSRIFSPYQFNPFNVNILRDILIKHVKFDELKAANSTNLFISATTVRTGKVRIFNSCEISLDVVMASACLPYLFQAVKVGDEYYWDGGYTGNPAIFPLFYKGTTKDVIVVHINPIIRSKLPTNSNEIMNRINEITFNSSLLHEFRAVAFVNKILEKGWIKDEYRHNLREILVHSIRADESLHDFNVSSKFDTHWNFLISLRDLGRIKAKEWLDENFDAIGERSTVDLHKNFLDDKNDRII